MMIILNVDININTDIIIIIIIIIIITVIAISALSTIGRAQQGPSALAPSCHYPQLRFVYAHQLFRTQYTCFELDAVDIDWWMCIHFCLVP